VAEQHDHLVQTFIYGSRGLGDNASLRLEPGLDSGTEPLEANDVILLLSDGVFGVLDSDQMVRILLNHPDPQRAAEVLLDQAMAHGSTDNLTALVVVVPEQAPPTVEWTDDFDVLRTM